MVRAFVRYREIPLPTLRANCHYEHISTSRDVTQRTCTEAWCTGIVATADKILSGPMPGVWDKSTAGTAVALPGSSAGLMPAGQLRRSNVRLVGTTCNT